METKVKFRHLSVALKILVIFGWIMAGLTVFAFLIGFIEGILLSV